MAVLVRTTIVVLVLSLLDCVRLVSDARAGERRIEVDADQTATVVGTFASLAAVVTDLCVQAKAELRGFDATDRKITIDQVRRPLTDVIALLLAQENYLLGVREANTPGQPAMVAWIRVTGSKEAGSAVLGGGLTVPSDFGARPFKDESTSETRRAQQAVAARLIADEQHVAQLLATDAKHLARSLRQYPHIEELLRQMRTGQVPAVAAKLDAVIAELDALAGTGAD
jgi:hypothetical protein